MDFFVYYAQHFYAIELEFLCYLARNVYAIEHEFLCHLARTIYFLTLSCPFWISIPRVEGETR